MEKTYLKNIILISLIMILIQIGGLIYQLVVHSSTTALILKIIFLVFFAFILFSIRLKVKFTPYLTALVSVCVIILSCIYMDFLSAIVSLMLLYYAYRLYQEQHTKQIQMKIK